MTNEFFDMSNGDTEKYMLLDLSNHMHRCRHGITASGHDKEDNDYALHLAINNLYGFFKEINPTKIVIAVDDKSWRKEVLPIYKAGRTEAREKDDGWEQFMEYIKEFEDLLREHSSMVVLKHPKVEADDWIARWIQTHPMDQHIIVSSDKDFYQLHAKNVKQYHPVKEEYIVVDNPQWELFLKCIRGETAKTSDNIPSAYPGVRVDKLTKAYAGDTFLMETIMQHDVPDITKVKEDGSFEMVKVRYLFERNKMLIDLTMQPQEVKDIMDATIDDVAKTTKKFEMFYFLRYLGRHELNKIAEQADKYIKMLNL